jgi:anti-sigma factor RsiW
MSDRPFDPDRVLPCGRTLGVLLDFLADSAPAEFAEHLRTCPHCQADLAELDADWAPVRRVAHRPIEPPDTEIADNE